MSPGEMGQAALAKYGAIAGGLMIGTAAKYGLLLTDGKRLTVRSAIADLLLLGMLGLLAVAVSDWLHLTGNAKVLAGALAAVSSDRLIRLARDRFLKTAESQMSRLLPAVDKESIMRVPAGSGDPESVGIEVPAVTREERVGASLRRSYLRAARARVPEDQIEQLRKLDGD